MKTLKKQIKTLLFSIALIIGVNSYSQNKPDKIKVYKAWVKLMNGSIEKGVLYLADSTGVSLSDGMTSDNLQYIEAEKIREIRIRKKGSVGKGVWIGALSGATLGAIIGLASGDDQGGWFGFSKEEKAAMNAVGFGVVGAGFGALGGNAKKKIIINGHTNIYLENLKLIKSNSLTRNTK
ncbi:hypothetical protein RXV94_03585 [Yeosuana sp. MJ-SS3]|uniref:Glycine zipper family protein n=1 Tax=Gilvirhabdus luticola TaxID=3079858 RepID=A0ABU3U494_9FLAO|nr:hypothetical protein [Yeosuana sp. MJ-SS3]MDU8885228.1 hypothetical protein [Yeosuana sp. MJ-SS3]